MMPIFEEIKPDEISFGSSNAANLLQNFDKKIILAQKKQPHLD